MCMTEDVRQHVTDTAETKDVEEDHMELWKNQQVSGIHTLTAATRRLHLSVVRWLEFSGWCSISVSGMENLVCLCRSKTKILESDSIRQPLPMIALLHAHGKRKYIPNKLANQQLVWRVFNSYDMQITYGYFLVLQQLRALTEIWVQQDRCRSTRIWRSRTAMYVCSECSSVACIERLK